MSLLKRFSKSIVLSALFLLPTTFNISAQGFGGGLTNNNNPPGFGGGPFPFPPPPFPTPTPVPVVLQDLYVGSNSSGQTTNFDAGKNLYSNSYISYISSDSNNRLNVNGSETLFSNSANIYVGYSGVGSMNINGASVVAGNTTIGANSESSGKVTMNSGNWMNNGNLVNGSVTVGSFGSGELIISGGNVFSGFGIIAENANSLGSVSLSGGLWSNSQGVYIGNLGSGSMTISGQGTLIDAVGCIGLYLNSSGSVTVSGGQWNNSSFLQVGNYGSGTLNITGGQVTDDNGYIGINTHSTGSVNISAGEWDNGLMAVGSAGVGSLNISGGIITSGFSYIGQDTGTGIVSISGGLWSNSAVLTIGGRGNGKLTFNGSGTVIADGVVIASESNSTGTLNFGSLGAGDSIAANPLITPFVAFGDGAGTINFNQINAFTLSNAISGNGSVIQLGSGTTIVAGSNCYTGLTTITRGTLVAESTNALGASDVTLGGTAYGATLRLATNLTVTTGGPPHYDLTWGSNGVIALAQGTHTLTLAGGMNNAAGANEGANAFQFLNTSLNNDTNVLISFGSQSGFSNNSFSVAGISGYSFGLTATNVTAFIAPTANLVVSTGLTLTNALTVGSYTVAGGATLVVAPGGILSASSEVLLTGNSTLDNNGLLVTPSLTVNEGSALMGIGTLSLSSGNLKISGRLAPGNSPGTFFVTGGNLAMGATGIWDEQIYSTSVYDRVVVTGSALLNGTLNITAFGGGGLEYGQKYNFLTASGGISGAFTSITAPEGFRGRLLSSGTEANILIAPASYTQLAESPNQYQVAKALDSFVSATSGDKLTVSTSLDSLTAPQYAQAFNAIMPTMYQSMATIAFNQANAQNMEFSQRLWSLRVAEGGGFSISGLADNYAMIQEGQGDGAGSGKGVLDSKKDILRPGADNHWGMFVDANGIFANATSGNMLPGYNAQSGGITAGLTYKWNENFASGIYCGYQGTYAKMGANGSGLGTGSILIDNAVRFGVFGTYGQKDGKGFYGNALAGGAYHNYQATRVIQYTGVNRTANSAPGAGELDTMLATGYDVKKGNLTFGPMASLQYTYLGVNGVNETGAQSLDFNSGGWNSSSMLSSVGAHAAYNWQAGKNILVIPQLSLSWQHEFLQNPYAINGSIGGSPSFSNTSATGIRDYLYTGVGFTVEFAKKWNTSFFYNAAAGNSDLQSQNIFWSAGVKF